MPVRNAEAAGVGAERCKARVVEVAADLGGRRLAAEFVDVLAELEELEAAVAEARQVLEGLGETTGKVDERAEVGGVGGKFGPPR